MNRVNHENNVEKSLMEISKNTYEIKNVLDKLTSAVVGIKMEIKTLTGILNK